jgi:two-component system, response regulator PdtaR
MGKVNTVLVVEDEALVNQDIAEALRDHGFEALQAYNGEQALKLLETVRDIRVLFTDVNLPGRLNGVELAKVVQIRWPRIEVLVTSANSRPEIEALDVVAQLGRFVQKPYPTGAVTRRIHEIVARQAS